MTLEHGPIQARRIEPMPVEKTPLSHYEAYTQAAQLLTEKISHNGEVTSYRPYYYTVEGKNGQHNITSRYASVEMQGRKAWFEIFQDTPEVPATEISFITSHPLDTILGNTQNVDTQKTTNQIDDPQPGNSIVRLVSFEEVPLIDGYQRVTDPQELFIASQKIVEHLLPEDQQTANTVKVTLPKPNQLEAFSSEQLTFTPLYEASNGTRIGVGKKIEATVGDNETREVFVYPVMTTDEARATTPTYLISTEEINPEARVNRTGLIGREDSICGCEKFGTHVLNHSCGHEILGSLKKQPRGNVPVVIAWDSSGDCNANGSVMHSLKSKNLEKLSHVSSDLATFSTMHEQDIALADRRNFQPLAQTLAAATEFFDTGIFVLQSTNPNKINAMNVQLDRIDASVYLIADPHEKRVVPDSVRFAEQNNGERPHKYSDRGRYSSQPS